MIQIGRAAIPSEETGAGAEDTVDGNLEGSGGGIGIL